MSYEVIRHSAPKSGKAIAEDEHLEHKASVYTNPNNNGKLATDSGQWVSTEDYVGNHAVRTGKFTISYGHVNGPKSDPITTLHVMPDQGRHDCTVIMNVSGGNSNASWFNSPAAVTQFITSNFKKTCRLSDQECSILGRRCVNLLRKHYAQHEGYYSPNLSHAAVDDDEIIDCTEDKVLEHLEHAQHNYRQSVPHSDNQTQTVYFYSASYSASTREGEGKTGAFSATFYAYVGFSVDEIYSVSGTINRGQIKAKAFVNGKFQESSKIYDESLQGLRNAIDEALSLGVKNGKVASGQAAKAAVRIWDEKQRIESSRKANRPPKATSQRGISKIINHSYTVISSQDELYHHGILGQKWGVRRYQNKDGSLTEAGKKHYGVKSINDIDILKKGTELSSVRAVTAREFIGNGGKPASANMYKNRVMPGTGRKLPMYTYLSNNEHDNKVYKGPFAYYLAMRNGFNAQIYEYKYKTLGDLAMPKKEDRVNEFKKLYDDEKKEVIKDLSEMQKHMVERYGSNGGKEYVRGNSHIEKIKQLNLNDLKTDEDYSLAYELFNHAMEAAFKYKSTTEYMKRMSNKYDAMIDDNNKDVYNNAQSPIIIFNAAKVLESVKDVSLVKVDEVMKNMNEIDEEMKKEGRKIAL